VSSWYSEENRKGLSVMKVWYVIVEAEAERVTATRGA
jgi:hypothetical protein